MAKEYFFDTDARIRAWITADTAEEAIEEFIDGVTASNGVKIDIGDTDPVSEKEI